MNVDLLGREPQPDEDLCNLRLSDAGYSGFDLYDRTEKIGNIDETNTLRISVVFEGKELETVATKE